jgi:thiamine biosynthesis lipoprotein
MNTLAFPCMGSSFLVEAENALELKRWFIEVEGKYSRFKEESVLSQWNQVDPSDEWVSVSEEFYGILLESELYKRRTDSFFNPYLGNQLIALGYDRSFSDMQRQVSSRKKVNDFSKESPLLFHPEKTMVKKVKDVSVDLGGFVKGWSVDEAFHMARGNDRFIDGGGDMRFSFKKSTVIGVMNPFHYETDIVQLKMSTGAMATSSVGYRRWMTEEGEVHHLVNGQTGTNSTSNVIQVTVLAKTARQAEVYAKALCMMNAEEGEKWIKERRLPLAAIMISKDRQIVMTEKLNELCEGVETAWS